MTEDIDMREFVDTFRTEIRRYWKMNVKKYFSKRERQYGLDPKINHRFVFARSADGPEPRLKNALIVNWTPDSNHITVNVAPIMVKSVTIGRRVPKGTKTMTGESANGSKAYDLITLLGSKQRPSKGKWIAKIDARVFNTKKMRQSSDPRIWQNWFDRFTDQLDERLEEFADKLADKMADKLVPVEEF